MLYFFTFLRTNEEYCLRYRNIIEHEGPRSLFKGLGPNIVGVAPSRAIYFCAYSQSKKFFNSILTPDTAAVHIISASFAGKWNDDDISTVYVLQVRQLLYRLSEKVTIGQKTHIRCFSTYVFFVNKPLFVV